ncbi:hypothetical protein VULLAG_LOCUS13844 [Vulpes lagopus]
MRGSVTETRTRHGDCNVNPLHIFLETSCSQGFWKGLTRRSACDTASFNPADRCLWFQSPGMFHSVCHMHVVS